MKVTNQFKKAALLVLKQYLPKTIAEKIKKFYVESRNQVFFKQRTTTWRYGNFLLTLPKSHPIIKLQKTQPYRDLSIGVSAKYMYQKYPDKVIIDIGANVGDTAALIASQAKNQLLLIESSDYYYKFLVKNSSLFENRVKLLKCFIGSGESISGDLVHWGGTAYFLENSNQPKIPTARLDDVCQDNTCLVKIDTDGLDFDIILSSLDFLKRNRSALIFENQIRNLDDLNKCNDVFKKLSLIGYENFIFWDDPGFLITSTNSLSTVADLNRYLFDIWQHTQATKSIYNYDVLCLTEDDKDVFESVKSYYSRSSIGLSE
jgi:FkbM family methyltransferase